MRRRSHFTCGDLHEAPWLWLDEKCCCARLPGCGYGEGCCGRRWGTGC